MDELLSVKGIGNAMLSTLYEHHITTINQLIHTFPKRYEIHHIDSIDNMKINEKVTLKATLTKTASVVYLKSHLTKMTMELESDTITFKAIIFNREFIKSVLKEQVEVVVTGKFEDSAQVMVVTDIELAKSYKEGIIPIYQLEGLSDKIFAKLVNQAELLMPKTSIESIPKALIEKHGLLPSSTLLRLVHRPESLADIDAVMNRLKYEELLRYGIQIASIKKQREQWYSIPKQYDIDAVRQWIKTLPFELTADQKKVTNDIFRDFKKPQPMLRLLQGDVGSGKTICAIIAMYAVVTAKQQVAFMAPTELLAYQHYQTFQAIFSGLPVTIVLLSSSIKGVRRTEILKQIETGGASIIIGTHSLIQEQLRFHQLGFVIIDEQHRFGVDQRKRLRMKGYMPDVLLMSATPIPRTLSMIIFGDMDISVIEQMPKGRIPIKTTIKDMSYLSSLKPVLKAVLAKGEQAYFIVPTIEGKMNADLTTVDKLYHELSEWIGSDNVEALHGKMKGEIKTDRLNRFASGKISVLVATSVVEVGLNALNATLMVIVNAERFGLSQLHQLRGRVGRSHLPSECYLLSDQVLTGNHRLDVLEKTTDGFSISEEDLRLRGPGELLGEEQTGIPIFQYANLIEDRELLMAAFEDARQWVNQPDSASKRFVKEIQDLNENHQID